MDDGWKMALGLGLFMVFGLVGVALLAAQGRSTQASYGLPVAMPVEAVGPTTSATVLENEERVILVRGPDRLLEEIIIHRKVIQNA